MLFSRPVCIRFRTAAFLPLFLACAIALKAEPGESQPAAGAGSPPAVVEESQSSGSSTSVARIPPREYYAVILNRKPFGDAADLKPAAPVDQQAELAAAEQAKQEQNLARQIDMVAITRSPTGKTLVGLVDKSDGKNPRNYCLAAGESAGGFTITEASFTDETATIEREGVSITLKLGKGVVQKTDDAAGAAADPKATGAAAPSLAAPTIAPAASPHPPAGIRPGIRPGLIRSGESAAAGTSGTPRTLAPGSYARRIRERRASEAAATQEEIAKLRQQVEEAAKTSKEEAAKRERAINLELISRGQQPLSQIELTPEEDAELVRKGVLDPEEKQ